VAAVTFGAGRETTEFINCNFDGLRANHIYGGNARFVGCSFRDVDIREFLGHGVELVECVFSGRIRTGWLTGDLRPQDAESLGRTRNQVEGNDFTETTLGDFEFRTGIDLSQQQLPDGENYVVILDARAVLQRVRARLATSLSDDLDLRQACLRLLDFDLDHGIGSREGQQWILWTDGRDKTIPNALKIRETALDLLSNPGS
jgi:uncharacterized protein YjbI with pentapeptide repeats